MQFSTAIGSLPEVSEEEAMELAFSVGVPFLPERSQDMGFLERFESVLHSKPLALESAFAKLAHQRKTPRLKIQVCGPLTFQKARPLPAVEVVVERLLQWQRKVREASGSDVWLFLDEPTLSPLTTVEEWNYLKVVVGLLRLHLKVGIHCCNQAPIARVLSLQPAFFSMDFQLLEREMNHAILDVAGYQGHGGILIYGLIPTNDGPMRYSLPERFKALTAYREKLTALSPEEHSGLSPACGLRNLTLEQARSTLQSLTLLQS